MMNPVMKRIYETILKYSVVFKRYNNTIMVNGRRLDKDRSNFNRDIEYYYCESQQVKDFVKKYINTI